MAVADDERDGFDPIGGSEVAAAEDNDTEGQLEGEYRPKAFDDEDGFEDLFDLDEDGSRKALSPGDPDREIKDEDEDEDEDAPDEDEDAPDEDEDAPDEDEDDLRARLEAADRRAAQLEQTVQGLVKSQQESASARFKIEQEEHEKRLEAVKGKIKKAIADGDVDAQLEATDELTDLKASPPVEPTASTSGADNGAAPGGSLPPKAQVYLDQNPWILSPRHTSMREALDQLDRSLQASGISPDSDEYYDRATSKLRKQFPRSRHLINGLPKSGRRQGRESPAHRGADREAPTGPGRKASSKAITAADVRAMRQFGLNPRDKAVREDWIKNRKEADL